jgi:hypothetical protein
MRSEAVCMPMPARPLEHTSCSVFVWVATACPVLWAGVLEFRDTVNAVLCAVRDWGMRNIWFSSVSLCVLFAFASSICSNVVVQPCPLKDKFMNQDAQRDVMYFVTDCLQFYFDLLGDK